MTDRGDAMQGRFDSLTGALRALGLGAVLWTGAQVAVAAIVGAGPVQGGDRQGYRGEQVSLSFSEAGLQGLIAADLSFDFDATRLKLVGRSADCDPAATAPICISLLELDTAASDPSRSVYSLWLLESLFAGLPDGTSTPLFTLFFEVLANAPLGDTHVNFRNAFDFSQPDDGVYGRGEFTGTLTVLDRNTNAVPITGTGPLTLTALALLALASRRCSGLAGRNH